MTDIVLFKTHKLGAHGWRERKLEPLGGLTDILAQEISYSGDADPEVGDRLTEILDSTQSDDSKVYGRDGDWVISRIQVFQDQEDSGDRVIVCYCEYHPVAPEWEEISRGAPADELLAAK